MAAAQPGSPRTRPGRSAGRCRPSARSAQGEADEQHLGTPPRARRGDRWWPVRRDENQRPRPEQRGDDGDRRRVGTGRPRSCHFGGRAASTAPGVTRLAGRCGRRLRTRRLRARPQGNSTKEKSPPRVALSMVVGQRGVALTLETVTNDTRRQGRRATTIYSVAQLAGCPSPLSRGCSGHQRDHSNPGEDVLRAVGSSSTCRFGPHTAWQYSSTRLTGSWCLT